MQESWFLRSKTELSGTNLPSRNILSIKSSLKRLLGIYRPRIQAQGRAECLTDINSTTINGKITKVSYLLLDHRSEAAKTRASNHATRAYASLSTTFRWKKLSLEMYVVWHSNRQNVWGRCNDGYTALGQKDKIKSKTKVNMKIVNKTNKLLNFLA